MKKFGMLLLVLSSILVLGACGGEEKATENSTPSSSVATTETSSKPTEITIEVENQEVTADKDGNATIKGKTYPGARVAVGMGILGDSVEADKDGNFQLSHKLNKAEVEKLDVNATLETLTAKTSVTVTPSQEMIDQEAKNNDITNVTKEPTTEQATILNNLANQQFNEMFPYKGSKIKSVLGVIQPWIGTDGHWFYKAEATIVNGFGAEQDTTVEITINPTDPKSGEVSIINY